jgi:acyl-CoA synthetase (AMP-forming)/AMP-acid ligase II
MAEAVFGVTQSQIGQPAIVDFVDSRALRVEKIARPVEPGAPGAEAVVSSGTPIGGMAVRVLDEHKNDLPDRAVGEIAIQSSYMLTGYHRRPDATAAAFHEGWYLTGDIGYVAEGEVYVLGRKKDLIIVGGRNVYPHDLEMLVNTVEGVHPGRVAIFGVPNPERGTEEVAVIAEIDDLNGDHRKIAADIRRVVAAGSDVAVRYVELVPRGWLIKTSSGKVSRSANREKYLESLAQK